MECAVEDTLGGAMVDATEDERGDSSAVRDKQHEEVLRRLDVLTEGQRRLEILLRAARAEQPAPVRQPTFVEKALDEEYLVETCAPVQPAVGDGVGASPETQSQQVAGKQTTEQAAQRMCLRRQKSIKQEVLAAYSSLTMHQSMPMPKSSTLDSLRSDNNVQGSGWQRRQRFPLHPDSSQRIVLDTIGMVFMLTDCILIPLMVTFEVEHTGPVAVINTLALLFWIVDMCIGFVCGYVDHGRLVMTPPGAIVRHYLKTSFGLFLIGNVAQAASISLHYYRRSHNLTGQGIARLLRGLRLLQGLRLFGLWTAGRISKVYERTKALTDKLHFGRQYQVAVKVGKLILLIMWMAHVGACLWRHWASPATDMWYKEHGMPVQNRNLFDYCLCYYQAFSTLLTGQSITEPTSIAELVMLIFFLLFGLIVSSIIISVISDTLLDFRLNNHQHAERLHSLRQYLRQARVPALFSVAVENMLEKHGEKVRILEEEVVLLKNLQPAVANAIKERVLGSAVKSQTFIRACQGVSSKIVAHICAIAVEQEVVLPGHLAFELGAQAVGCYMAFWGKFEYVTIHRQGYRQLVPGHCRTAMPRTDSTMHGCRSAAHVRSRGHGPLDDSFLVEQASSSTLVARSSPTWSESRRFHHIIHECKWISELALFCHWQHAGSLHATEKGELLTIQADKFSSIIYEDLQLGNIFTDYGSKLLKCAMADLNQVDDLSLPMAHEGVLALMPSETRSVMSDAGLRKLERGVGRISALFKDAKLQRQLADEVRGGACDLVVKSELKYWNHPLTEEVLRVVSVCALRITRWDGKVLAQIGRMVDGSPVADVLLPGSKVRASEYPADAQQRVLDGPLSALKAFVVKKGEEVKVEKKESEHFRIPTKYVRHIVNASISEESNYTYSELEWSCVTSHNVGASHSLAVRERLTAQSMKSRQSRRANGHHHSHAPFPQSIMQAFVLGDTMNSDSVIYAWMGPREFEDEDTNEAVQALMRTMVPRSKAVKTWALLEGSSQMDSNRLGGASSPRRSPYNSEQPPAHDSERASI